MPAGEFRELAATWLEKAIDTRYPEIGVSYTKEMAKEAIQLAGQVLDFVEERMGESE